MSPERLSLDSQREHIALVEADDRNVFGVMGLTLSASVRARLDRRNPLMTRVRKLMLEGNIDDAEALLTQCMPRHEGDTQDSRYFGVYWTAGDLAQQRGNPSEAIQNYIQAIQRFPQELRKGHLQRLEALGVATAKSLLERGGNLAETDAAAVLQNLLQLRCELRGDGVVVFSQMSAAREMFGSLEHTGSRAYRSDRQR
jgi:tetratricopeptide (TPR) repeat protein